MRKYFIARLQLRDDLGDYRFLILQQWEGMLELLSGHRRLGEHRRDHDRRRPSRYSRAPSLQSSYRWKTSSTQL